MNTMPEPTASPPRAHIILSRSPAQTIRVGEQIGELLWPGDLVLLLGIFGAGKTHLTKGIAHGLGAQEMVNSPSFTLINEYRAGRERKHFPIYHVDLYRLDSVAALIGIGLEEALSGDGVCVIEWAEKARDWLPTEHLAIHLHHLSEDVRELRLEPHGDRYVALVEALALPTTGN